MKKLILLTLILSLFASCLPEATESTSSSVDATGDGTTNGGTTGGTTDSDNGSGDSGNTGTLLPVAVHSVFLAGGQNWFPQNISTPLSDTFLSLQEAAIAFQTDGLLRVKIKVKSQPSPPVNQTYCYGRNTGSSYFPYYTKLKFDVSLVDITCPGGGSSCDPSQYSLGTPYRTQYGLGPINTDSFSEVIDIGQYANQGVVATAIQITNVRSGQYCEATNGVDFCPAERQVRTLDCFNMDVHVQTSFTESL
jgi:hypothetical protein